MIGFVAFNVDWRDKKISQSHVSGQRSVKGYNRSKWPISLILLKMLLLQTETQDHHTWSVEQLHIATYMVLRDKGQRSHKGH